MLTPEIRRQIRNTIKGATSPSGRAWRFYNYYLIPTLARDISKAEQARQAGQHQAVQETFDFWTNRALNEEIFRKLAEREVRFSQFHLDLSREEDLIRAGLAGMARIQHVDTNSELKTTPDTQQLPVAAKRINPVSALYRRIPLHTLPPWTIHEGATYWPAEVAQDWANTYTILGNPPLSEQIVQNSLQEASQLNLLIGGIDFQTSDDTLKTLDYNRYRQRKLYLGAYSAQGVLWARHAKLSGNLEEMVQGLGFIALAHHHEPNPHRLATIAMKTVAASASNTYHGPLLTRATGLILGTARLTEAFFSDPKATYSALTQALRERRSTTG